MKKDFEEKRLIVEKLRPIDDAFFEKIIEDRLVCEEILRVIMEDPDLKVIRVIPQGSIRNLQGRSVRLDAFCVRGDGSFCNIEVQKSDKDNHYRRTRYNAACITANITEPGEHFENVPDVYIVYISDFDIMRSGLTIYHVDPVVRELGLVLDNGHHEIYVNTKVNDGSEIAELMQCFLHERIANAKFQHLANRVNWFKDEEEGVETMCSLIEEYGNKRELEGKAEGKAESILELLQEYGQVPDNLKQRILEESDTMKLSKWLKLSVKVRSVKQFAEQMDEGMINS